MTADDSQGDTYPITSDPDGYYNMTVNAGTYTATASLADYTAQSRSASITSGQVTTLKFALQQTPCVPVNGFNFTWAPLEPFNGDFITFNGTTSDTEPINFQWYFGDTSTVEGDTIAHTYMDAGEYTVE